MSFQPNTQDELKALEIVDGKEYLIEYLNKDYFNGEETLEKARAKAIINEGKIIFIVPDPYGMDRFIDKVKVIN